MNHNNDINTWGQFGGSAVSAAVRNKVLRNTYLLLALSMLPTVLGAWVGLSTGLAYASFLRGWIGALVFFGGAIGFMFAIEKNKNSGLGVALLLGFTFFMGVMLSRMLGMVLGFKNGADLIMTAFAGTAGVFAIMATLATTIKRDLSGMGKWLFVGVCVLVVSSLVNLFFQSSALTAVISTLGVFIFSAYLLYDIKQIVDGGETNYVSATLSLYLNLFNLFQNLLALLGIFGGERE